MEPGAAGASGRRVSGPREPGPNPGGAGGPGAARCRPARARADGPGRRHQPGHELVTAEPQSRSGATQRAAGRARPDGPRGGYRARHGVVPLALGTGSGVQPWPKRSGKSYRQWSLPDRDLPGNSIGRPNGNRDADSLPGTDLRPISLSRASLTARHAGSNALRIATNGNPDANANLSCETSPAVPRPSAGNASVLPGAGRLHAHGNANIGPTSLPNRDAHSRVHAVDLDAISNGSTAHGNAHNPCSPANPYARPNQHGASASNRAAHAHTATDTRSQPD